MGRIFFDVCGCIECGAALPNPSGAVCVTCLRSAADTLAELKGKTDE